MQGRDLELKSFMLGALAAVFCAERKFARWLVAIKYMRTLCTQSLNSRKGLLRANLWWHRHNTAPPPHPPLTL